MLEKKRQNRQTAVKIIVTALILILALYLLQRLLMPKYMGDVVEGAMIQEYYDENKDHDVVFVGDCELYENISPEVLWEEYGINSYIRGSAQQLIWQSYYLMEETLSYEKPDVLVFNVLSMQYNEPQRETYNRMTLDGMRWSPSKVKSILASMTEEEHFIEYVFPILRYHTRWNELTEDDITYFWDRPDVTFNGYYLRVDVKPAENVPEGRVLADYSFGDNAWKYLDMMRELCKKNDVELVLVKAPSLYPYWYDEWDQQIVDYAREYGLKYYNLLNAADEMGLDYNTDTYDGGLHLNLSGAEKCARYIGEILTRDCGLTSRRGEPELERLWAGKLEDYKNEIHRQYKELEKTEEK